MASTMKKTQRDYDGTDEHHKNKSKNIEKVGDVDRPDKHPSDTSGTTSETVTWIDDIDKNSGPLAIPEGAAMIVREIAARAIFFDMVNVIVRQDNDLDNPTNRVDHDHVHNLLRQFPGLCHETFEVDWDDGEKRVLHPLSIMLCLQPSVDLIEFIYHAYPAALHHAESSKRSMPIHYAATFSTSVAVLDFLIEQDQETVKKARNDGMLPLHLAAYFRASFDVVNRLAQVYPEAAFTADCDGWTVLHTAAAGLASLDVMKSLFALNPDNVYQPDHDRRTPLLLACRKKNNLPVVSFLLQQAPELLNREDDEGETALFRASRSQSLDVVQMLVSAAIEDASRAQNQDDDDDDDDDDDGPTQNNPQPLLPPLDGWGATLLHFAASDNTSDVCTFLLEAFPSMATKQTIDAHRFSPLHEACEFDAPFENIQAIVDRVPRECLLMLDSQQRTPLHVALSRKGKCSLPTVSLLLERAPEALNIEDEEGVTALFRAARCQSADVLQLLLSSSLSPGNDNEENKKPTPPVDSSGATLLHYAASDNTLEVCQFLLQEYPSMAESTTADGHAYTALHDACEFGAPLDNIRLLLQHSPRSLWIPNSRGKTPLQLAQEMPASEELIDLIMEATWPALG